MTVNAMTVNAMTINAMTINGGEHQMTRKILAAATAVAFLLAACSDDEEGGSSGTESTAAGTSATDAPETTAAEAENVRQVPDEYDTIQAAVDASAPGDLVLVGPGTYNEAVQVATDDLTIRGLDRNEVILDGNFELDNGIRVLGANHVAVENMTAMNYTKNGFFWTGVDGYRGSYLTAYRTGDYGVYAFDSINGQIDHIYAAGSPDAGVYIGECYPCNAVVSDVVSEYNGLGYSGTNSGGNLLIVNSTWRYNRAGIVPNSGSYELCYPERETTIVGNIVHGNNNGETPAIDVALLAMGNGIVVPGGVLNTIERNLVYDHDKGGISLVPFPEEDPNDAIPGEDEWTVSCEEAKQQMPVDPGDLVIWESMRNRVVGNVLEDNRHADLLVAAVTVDASTLGHCFADNTFTTSAPNNIETLAPCTADGVGVGSGDWADGKYDILSWLGEEHPPSVDWKTATLPELQPQENMPDAATAPARPANDVPMQVDLASIVVPTKPAG